MFDLSAEGIWKCFKKHLWTM